jgi:hypothetical protein
MEQNTRNPDAKHAMGFNAQEAAIFATMLPINPMIRSIHL